MISSRNEEKQEAKATHTGVKVFDHGDKGRVRLLFLKGDEGWIATRIHSRITYGTLPSKSPHASRIELATRSNARLRNLAAVRKGGMVGPADYYGNLEEPHKKLYTIKITNHIPNFFQQPYDAAIEGKYDGRIEDDYVTTVRVAWNSGFSKHTTEKKRLYLKPNEKAESLFPNLGILEVEASEIKLKSFDARGVDFSSYKAELVRNDTPFRITSCDKLDPSDECRAVSYQFNPGYGYYQVNHGGGLFLETHFGFAQTMTPLDEHSGGYVVIGKWKELAVEHRGEDGKIYRKSGDLELMAIQIPFGYTLIIREGCIHGDATLIGSFMMCMTSNHITMQEADSVFLKSTDTKTNLSITLDKLDVRSTTSSEESSYAPSAYILYKDKSNLEDFYAQTKHYRKRDFITKPTSIAYLSYMANRKLRSSAKKSTLSDIDDTRQSVKTLESFAKTKDKGKERELSYQEESRVEQTHSERRSFSLRNQSTFWREKIKVDASAEIISTTSVFTLNQGE